MAAAGNIYRHEYEDVAAHRVWQTLTVSLPKLLSVIEREIPALSDQIAWVTVQFELPNDVEERLTKSEMAVTILAKNRLLGR